MRWYQYQYRKPKRWARRAKSDGSAAPRFKRKIDIRRYRWYRRFQRVHVITVALMMLPMLGLLVFMRLFKLELEGLPVSVLSSALGLPSLFDLFGIWLQVSGISLQICGLLLVLNLIAFVLGIRAERRYVLAHRCHLCPRCGYSLQSRTSDDQPCSECGQRISRREAVRLWARFCR